MPPCPKCRSISTRLLHRTWWQKIAHPLLHVRPFKCNKCRHEFAAKVRSGLKVWQALLFVGLMTFGFLGVTLDHRDPVSSARKLAGNATLSEEELQTTLRKLPRQEREEIAQKAWRKVRRLIAAHRGEMYLDKDESIKNVKRFAEKDDIIYALVRRVFKKGGVPDALVEESLRDWSRGVNVLEIGARWREQGVDIPKIVREAEAEGLPVREILRKKDTGP